MIETNKLVQLAKDSYFGVCQYSVEESSDIIRNMIMSELEPLPEKKSKYKSWMRRNGDMLFDILTEVITPIQNELLLSDLGGLVETRNFDIGDKIEYTIENPDLFEVGVKATGLHTIRRERLFDRKVPTEGFSMGVKIYTELFSFLTGDINWTRFCDKAVKSFDRKIFTLATATLFSAYDTVNNADFCKQVNVAGLADALDDLVAKVGDNVGAEVIIAGTKQALSKIDNVGTVVLDDISDKRQMGHVSIYKGSKLVELPNYYDKDLKAFDIPTDMLLILPSDGQGLVKLATEGDLEIYETSENDRLDYQLEMELDRRIHLGVAVANTYGMIKIQ